MASESVLSILLKARDEASKVLEQTGQNASKMNTAFSVGKAVVGAFGTTAIGFLSDIAREGAEDAASMETVRVAVENAGGAWEDAGPAIDEYLNKMRDTRAIADDDLKPALASLIAVTGDYQRSMELASLAADVARGKHIDLQTATTLVGRVAQGNTGILQRYGIVLGENATAEEALAELQRRFAGQAEAYGQTTKGQLEIMSLKIGDFREQLGQTMGPAMSVVGMLPGLSAGFTMVGGAVGAILPAFPGLAATLTGTVIPAIGATIVALGPILIPIAAIGAAIGLLALAWINNWGDIQGKTQAVLGTLEAWFENFRKTVEDIWNGVTGAIRDAINGVIRIINGFINAINSIKITLPSVEIPSWVPGLGGQTWGGTIGFPHVAPIPYLATGGIITRPTLALVGEAGPEAVVPLSQLREALAGAGAVNVQMTVMVNNTEDAHALAYRIAQEIQRRRR
jgi:hypothetical protein